MRRNENSEKVQAVVLQYGDASWRTLFVHCVSLLVDNQALVFIGLHNAHLQPMIKIVIIGSL
jgi:hypothetical protein